uniref:CDC42 small effector protein 1 n=1 Tax=Bos mutus grunniens TaxID=30521 RepID=A0A8B9WYG2_BOSMU
ASEECEGIWDKPGCCMVEKPELNKRSRTDWAVVGEPMNFVHLIHIGPGDMRAGDGLATTGASQGQLRPRELKPWTLSDLR